MSAFSDGSDTRPPEGWQSPFLKPAPHQAAPVPGPPTRRWVRLLVLTSLVAACAAGAWYFRAPLGLAPATVISLAPPDTGAARQPAAGAGANPAATASDAPHGPAELASRAAPDSLRQRTFDATRLVGVWHHGDARSRYGDSLTLRLEGDGSASSVERRYTLDRTGWHLSRVSRTGTWNVLVREGRPVQLCTAWTTPTSLRACDDIELARDSSGTRVTLQFAGRHWRLDPAAESRAVRGGARPAREGGRPRLPR